MSQLIRPSKELTNRALGVIAKSVMDKRSSVTSWPMLKRSLVIFLPLLALVIGSGILIYYQHDGRERAVLETHVASEVDHERKMIAGDLDSVVADLMYLAGKQELREMLAGGSSAYAQSVAKGYLRFSVNKRLYDKIRFLDETGMEVVRIDFNNGNPKGFERLYQQAQTEKAWVIEREKGTYGFDHTLIGLTLLDCWNLDSQLGDAILNHHEYKTEGDPASLESLLKMADYLADAAGLGFFSELPLPPVEVLEFFECSSEEGLGELQEQILQRFEEERALFTGS